MLNKYFSRLLFLLFVVCGTANAQSITEKYLHNQTPTYKETASFFKGIALKDKRAQFKEIGLSDGGVPIHLFVISNSMDFNPVSLKKKNKKIVLIMNAIHAGEPDGVDACMKLTQELLNNKSVLKNTVICIIPMYNVDGVLNRGTSSRANQNGPEEYGFRGNAKNLDLNRDFIKCDSKNAMVFTKLFNEWKPDIFVDTHVSDGADYQYVMTLIATQHNKLQHYMSEFMTNMMLPELYFNMAQNGYPMTPYVESHGRTPDTGLEGFLEIPRFSTGYAALYNTIGFVSESHMWKPYKDRVLATYFFLRSVIDFTEKETIQLGIARKHADAETAAQINFPLQWEIDTTKTSNFSFKGYEAKYKKSNISGLQRLYYDRKAPYEKNIKIYDEYKVTETALKPKAYLISQAWSAVIERLKLNNVKMVPLKKDTIINTDIYYISNYKTVANPYEGHYLHYNVDTHTEKQSTQYYKGDYIVYTNQPTVRYIMETLEPKAVDSFFAWNFFDSVLQQKEGFSDYIFEEKAEEILAANPALKTELLHKQQQDTSFAKNHRSQLNFIYQHSPYYEKSYMRYPIGRLVN